MVVPPFDTPKLTFLKAFSVTTNRTLELELAMTLEPRTKELSEIFTRLYEPVKVPIILIYGDAPLSKNEFPEI